MKKNLTKNKNKNTVPKLTKKVNFLKKQWGVNKNFKLSLTKVPVRLFIVFHGKKIFLTRTSPGNKFLLRKKHINFQKKINTLRGHRHKVFLPTRGQNTKTNAKTQKKKRNRHNFIKTVKKNASKKKPGKKV